MSTVNGFQIENEILKYNYEKLENYNTPDFDSSLTYAIGDYVMYEGKLYRCIEDIPVANDWDSTKWIEAILTEDIKTMKSHEIPSGGTTGEFLVKSSNVDYDVEWQTIPIADGNYF